MYVATTKTWNSKNLTQTEVFCHGLSARSGIVRKWCQKWKLKATPKVWMPLGLTDDPVYKRNPSRYPASNPARNHTMYPLTCPSMYLATTYPAAQCILRWSLCCLWESHKVAVELVWFQTPRDRKFTRPMCYLHPSCCPPWMLPPWVWPPTSCMTPWRFATPPQLSKRCTAAVKPFRPIAWFFWSFSTNSPW